MITLLSSILNEANPHKQSPMGFKLGAAMVKGGKIISIGHNHHRTHYDGADVKVNGHRKPVSMHAEMHAIYNVIGMSPSFKRQVQRPPTKTKGPPWRLSGAENEARKTVSNAKGPCDSTCG
jgi:tRNA(Arg) A34 adenosine deaminase TadA